MIFGICAITTKGRELQNQIINKDQDNLYIKMEDGSLKEFTEDCFSRSIPLVFIGALGIAVRHISEFVNDKLSDIPVVVIDEMGKHIIPVLSGHMGGANDIACYFSGLINGTPVITTATDVNNIFSVDVFARRNGFKICNRNGIKEISSKLLNNKTVSVFINSQIRYEKNDIPDNLVITDSENADIVITNSGDKKDYKCLIKLISKDYVIGMGCKKDSSFLELKKIVSKIEQFKKYDTDSIYALSSIDIKKKEMCLNEYALLLRVPFVTFSAEELMMVEGEFDSSSFVLSKTGTDNVCERAAVKAAGEDAVLIINKCSLNGFTFALSKRVPAIKTWNTLPGVN